MGAFQLLIDYDVVVFLGGLPKDVLRMLRARLIEIRDHPASRADCFESDAVGREVAINICGSWAIKFWVDHADRQIKILDIHRADRRR